MNKVTALILGVVFLTTGLAYAQETASTQAEVKLVEVGNKICPVSGEPVTGTEMSEEAVTYEYNGKLYNLCCPACIKDFKKDPEKYSKIAEDEVKAAQE